MVVVPVVVMTTVCCWLSHYGNAVTTMVVTLQRHGGKNDDKHRFAQVVGLMSVNRVDQERKTCWKRDDDESMAQGPGAGNDHCA